MRLGRDLVILAAGLSALFLVACAPSGPAYEHPAVASVNGLLEVRSRASTDPAEYAPFLVESAVATALAEDAVARSAVGSRTIPAWKPPYLSAETSEGVDVTVVWTDASDFGDWPVAHRWLLVRVGDDWRVSDAVPATAGAIPQPLGE